MLKLSQLALIVAQATMCFASPVLAQTFDAVVGTGNVLPMIYDARGVKYRYVYGYYGPLFPPLAHYHSWWSWEAAAYLKPGSIHNQP